MMIWKKNIAKFWRGSNWLNSWKLKFYNMIFKDSGGLSVFWVDKMGVSTNDTSTGKYIYPNYESRHDLLQKVCK